MLMLHNDFTDNYTFNNFTNKESDVFFSIVSLASNGRKDFSLKSIKEKAHITFSYKRLEKLLQSIAKKSIINLETGKKMELFKELKIDISNKRAYIEFNDELKYMFNILDYMKKEHNIEFKTKRYLNPKIISKLKNLMEENDITSISELQRISKISRTTLQKLYDSKNIETISLKFIKELCILLNCSIEQLISIEEEDN